MASRPLLDRCGRGGTTFLPTIEESQRSGLGDLVPTESDAVDAETRSARLFGFPLLSRTLVVQRDADGLELAEQGRLVRRAYRLNRDRYPALTGIAGAIPFSNTLGAPPFSRERSTTAITYLFFRPDVGAHERTRLADRFVDRQIRPTYDGFVGVTGAVSAQPDSATSSRAAFRRSRSPRSRS